MKATGKSFSTALILVSTNPQYDKRFFIELRVQYMKIPSSEHVENMLRTQIVFFLFFLTFRLFMLGKADNDKSNSKWTLVIQNSPK